MISISTPSRGFPERFAQQALGHNSKAVHHACSKHAEVTVPSLADWEKEWTEKAESGKQKCRWQSCCRWISGRRPQTQMGLILSEAMPVLLHDGKAQPSCLETGWRPVTDFIW